MDLNASTFSTGRAPQRAVLRISASLLGVLAIALAFGAATLAGFLGVSLMQWLLARAAG